MKRSAAKTAHPAAARDSAAGPDLRRALPRGRAAVSAAPPTIRARIPACPALRHPLQRRGQRRCAPRCAAPPARPPPRERSVNQA